MTSASQLSVCLPVHVGADPGQLEEALASVAAQTLAAGQVVVVLDGPVSAAHESVLAGHAGLTMVSLPANVGSGLARRAAIEACTGSWVALVDADDVNEPHRFERQMELLIASGADVCSGTMTEFDTVTGPLGLRPTPLTHPEFARQMPTRNPVNQPATMFRRTAYERAGGYQRIAYLEDYDLWARMLATGARFIGTGEPLVKFRTDGMLTRRTTEEARRAERELQHRLRSYGLVGPVRSRLNLVVRLAYLRLPEPLLELAYRGMFRRRALVGHA